MKKRLEAFNDWLAAPAWYGQARAVFIIPALLAIIAILATIIRSL